MAKTAKKPAKTRDLFELPEPAPTLEIACGRTLPRDVRAALPSLN